MQKAILTIGLLNILVGALGLYRDVTDVFHWQTISVGIGMLAWYLIERKSMSDND